MAGATYNGAVVGPLDTLFRVGVLGGQNDAALLERFLAGGTAAEAAFEVLVARHGPLVLGACRRFLRDEHEAADAFQATFLVLVRRAGAVRRKDSLGPWLYGVARRVALRQRADSHARRAREARAAIGPSATEADKSQDDPYEALHAEIDRLPEKYRAPVVLCHLQGRTIHDTSRQLGWPAGTVAGRLARARDLLRSRLTRRGLALGSAAAATDIVASDATAAVPPALVQTTVKAAASTVGGTISSGNLGLASAQAVALSEGVLHAMTLTMLKSFAASIAVAGTILTAAGVLAYQSGPVQPGRAQTAVPKRPTDPNPRRSSPTYNLALPTDDDPSGREGRVESFPKEQDSFFAKLLQTRQQWDYNTVDRLFHWSRAVKEEQEYLSNHPKNQAAAREAHRDRMKRLYEKVQKLSGPDQASLTEAAGIDLEDAERELVKPSDVAPSPAASNRGLAQPPWKSDSSSKADRPGAPAQTQPGPFANPQFRESTRLVNIARVGALVAASDKSPKTKEILTKLEVPVAMRFADATPLDDVLKYIKIAVQGPKQDGIPIYVDPVGLAEVEKTIASPVILDVEGVPLKTTLRVALKQLGLAYCVKDGLLLISSPKGIIQELREAATEEQRDEFDYRGGFP
jgi:RNA polymerase sigma factor (sigma-70 family)